MHFSYYNKKNSICHFIVVTKLTRNKGAYIMDDKKILKQTDLYEILPFQKTKILQLLRSGQLPTVKVGKDYITTMEQLENWIDEHIGEEIYYE